MSNYITNKIQQLKQQKKQIKNQQDINNTNSDIEKNNIKQQLNQLEQERLNKLKAEKQEQKKQIVAETRKVMFNAYNLLRKIGIIQTKEAFSNLMNKHKSYFMVLECREKQGLSIETIKVLKDNLQQVKYNIELLTSEDDPNYTDWLKRKLQQIIEQIEQLEMKMMKVIYGWV